MHSLKNFAGPAVIAGLLPTVFAMHARPLRPPYPFRRQIGERKQRASDHKNAPLHPSFFELQGASLMLLRYYIGWQGQPGSN